MTLSPQLSGRPFPGRPVFYANAPGKTGETHWAFPALFTQNAEIEKNIYKISKPHCAFKARCVIMIFVSFPGVFPRNPIFRRCFALTKDMTVGSPMKLVFNFAIPLMFGNLFQQFYAMVDTIIVGRFLGTGPLAAVGSTGSINFLILGFCLGTCAGFTIPVAQTFGSKDIRDLKRFVGNIVWLAAGFSLVFTVATVVLCRPILQWMHTPADIIDDAYNYIVVIFLGIPTIVLYNVLASLLRALGDSRTPVVFLVVASLLNIGLDLFLILVIPLGVAGAAWATVISQGISGLACLAFIWKKFPLLHISRDDLVPRKRYMKRLLGMGVPMGLQSSITAIGSILLQTSVNGLGSVVVASVTAASKLYQLFGCVFDALGVSMSTYGGQNIGARRGDRIFAGLRSGMIIGSVYSVVALVVIIFFGRPMVQLFVDSNETAIIDQAYQFMVIQTAFFIPLAGVNVIRLLIQGMGYSKLAVFAGVFEMIARGSFGLFLVPTFGFSMACFASPAAWVLADAFLIPAYCRVMKHVKQYGY